MFFVIAASLMFLVGAIINIFYAKTSSLEEVYLLFLGAIIMLLFGIYYEIREKLS